MKFKDLPDDMQVLLSDLTGSYNLDEKELTFFELPVSSFPILAVESGWGKSDSRELADYLEPMRRGLLPPVVIVGPWWIDGLHRVAAARVLDMKNVKVVDLSEIGVDPKVISDFDKLGFIRRGDR